MSSYGAYRPGHLLTGVTLVGILAFLPTTPAGAVPPGSQAAQQALDLCNSADDRQLRGAEREEVLTRGLGTAEGALAVDPRDARAHFAAVCNLGKLMEMEGLGLGQLFSLRRLQRELDAALELAPSDPDALVAKGALLLNLPRLLGGDTAEAEVLLRRAFAAEPDNDEARCYLARALTARGADDEARALSANC